MRLRWLLPIYLAGVVLGWLLLRLPGTMVRGNELSPSGALFSVVNAVTLTGFAPQVGLEQYQPQGRIVVLALMAFGSLFVLVVGGIAGCRALGVSSSARGVTTFAVAVYGTAVTIRPIGMAMSGPTAMIGARIW